MSKPDKKTLFLWSAMEKQFPITGEGVVVSPEEEIEVIGIGKFQAKVDSGNDGYNVLHVDEYEIDFYDEHDNEMIASAGNVTFKTNGKLHTSPLNSTLDVRKGETVEKRPVISLDIVFKGTSYKNVPFSLSNRTGHGEPILIGKPFLHEIKAEIHF